MQKAHQNINWENKPSTETPINETNLNLMDRSIDTIDDRVVNFDTTKANQVDLLQACKAPTFDETTGILSFPLFNGTVVNIDTKLEKMPVNLAYDSNPSSPHYQHLILTLDDGTVEYIDLSALITQYEFVNSPRIAFTVGLDGSITADIIGGSITDDKMQPQYLADITAQANAGAQSAINASGFKLDAEAWANGTRNGQAVPSTDPAYHNNSKYWSQQANVTSFRSLTDVDIDDNTLVDGQYPAYNSNTGMWENRAIPESTPGVPIHFIIVSEEGSSVTVTKPDGDTITPTHTSAGHWECDVFTYGVYQIDAVLSGDDAQVSVNVDDCKIYIIDDSHFHASIVVTYPAGATVSCVKTGEPTQYATSSPYTFVVHSLGEYTITGTRNGITEVQTVTITASEQVVNITLTILPDGSTITPTDDVQILLNCADIWDKTYTTISQLIADDTSLLTVLTSDNAIDYLVRSTTFANDITADSDAMAMIGSYDYASDTLLSDSTWATAILNSAYVTNVENIFVPNMTSNTTPSGECSGNGYYYNYWYAFNGVTSDHWTSDKTGKTPNARIWYKFPSAKLINAFKYMPRQDSIANSSPSDYTIDGSNDGTNWTTLYTGTSESAPSSGAYVAHSMSNATNYQYLSMFISTTTGGGERIGLAVMQFYGREKGGVQSWLRAGGITDKSYTTLAEVLADTTTLSALIASHDAVDYLVTAKGFIDGIVADSNAMSYIGLNNYCANTLLADADWLSGIVNSAYIESVLNAKVPTMTSNTTPSGVASASTIYNTSYDAYKAFDNNTDASHGWLGSQSATSSNITYEFASANTFHALFYKRMLGSGTATDSITISGSNDGTTFTPIESGMSFPKDVVNKRGIVNSISYKWIRMEVNSTDVLSWGDGWKLQFYGREDV